MLEEKEIRAIGQKIVSEAKRTARVDTGALKRSIAFTYIRGEMIFREMFYGQFGTNSELEEIAKKYVPRGIPWKIIYTEFGGKTVEVGRTRTGRATQRTSLRDLLGASTNKIKALIARNRAKRNGEEKN